jgi:hypothetical protein
MKPKSENRLAAEAIIRTPEYWRDRGPDLHEQDHHMMQAEVGTKPVQTGRNAFGGKGNPL